MSLSTEQHPALHVKPKKKTEALAALSFDQRTVFHTCSGIKALLFDQCGESPKGSVAGKIPSWRQ